MEDDALYILAAEILKVDVARIRALFGATPTAPTEPSRGPAPVGG